MLDCCKIYFFKGYISYFINVRKHIIKIDSDIMKSQLNVNYQISFYKNLLMWMEYSVNGEPFIDYKQTKLRVDLIYKKL